MVGAYHTSAERDAPVLRGHAPTPPMPAPTLDTQEFSRRADRAAGTLALAELPRLTSLLLDDHGGIEWSLAGRSELSPEGARHGYLTLALHGRVRARCVRCLEAVELGLEARRDYRMVASEAQAEQQDLDVEAYDLLAHSRRFDLGELIEDEAIMALPAAPRHEHCRTPASGDAAEPPSGTAAPNPFAVLARLRRDGGEPDA
jgi:uncharacterized protein